MLVCVCGCVGGAGGGGGAGVPSGDKAGQPKCNATNLTWNQIEADADDILLIEVEDALMGTPHLLEVMQGWSECMQHRFSIPEGKGRCERIAASKEDSLDVNLKCRGNWVAGIDTPLDLAEPTRLAIPATIAPALASNMSMEIPKTIFDKQNKEHKFAKAVKSDDAEVPEWLWDKAVCGMEVSIDEKQALSVLSVFCLQQYRQKLWRQSRQYVGAKLGRINHPLVMYGR